MEDCIIALDIGGTKAHLVIESLDGRRILDTQIPSQDWDAEPVDQGAAWLAGTIEAISDDTCAHSPLSKRSRITAVASASSRMRA